MADIESHDRRTEAVGAIKSMTDEAAALRHNWIWFATMFAINHGVVTTPLVIATSVLDESVGYMGNALLNVFTVASTLTFAAPLVSVVGLKGGVLFGMAFLCVYAGLFAVAAFCKGHVTLQMIAFCLGSSCGGMAAGVLWTSQGAYFSRTVDLLSAQEPDAGRPALSAKLAGTFAVLYLSFEVAAKLLWALLDKLGAPNMLIAVLFTAIGVAALVGQTWARDIGSAEPAAHWSAKLKATVATWKDPAIFLLSGTNLTFGFAAAFMNGYVNANYTSKQLGSFAVAMLAAFTALTAACLSRLFGPLGARVGKGPMVVLGAACFLCIPLCTFLLGCCDDWGWGLIVLYALQGAGRAVFESTNKGVFADFFPKPADSVGAFANVMLQTTMSFALCFFLSDHLQGRTLGYIVTVLALLTPLGYAAAVRLQLRQAERPSEDGKPSDAGAREPSESTMDTESAESN
mmetsp:Transcript_38456/g.101697  ORF Transcript_38456/g.101697 Transcript_38456/m.101697 type:complete len:459 (-) Transcript_38456:295-1671(-)